MLTMCCVPEILELPSLEGRIYSNIASCYLFMNIYTSATVLYGEFADVRIHTKLT